MIWKGSITRSQWSKWINCSTWPGGITALKAVLIPTVKDLGTFPNSVIMQCLITFADSQADVPSRRILEDDSDLSQWSAPLSILCSKPLEHGRMESSRCCRHSTKLLKFRPDDLCRIETSCQRDHHTSSACNHRKSLAHPSPERLLKCRYLVWQVTAVCRRVAVYCVHGQSQGRECKFSLLSTGETSHVYLRRLVGLFPSVTLV